MRSATGCSEPLEERRLGPADAAAACPLSDEAGWNQTPSDWAFMLEAGHGRGLFHDGRPVATALVLRLGPALCWISMVLVTQEFRRRGLGSRLFARCLEIAQEEGRRPGLDATGLGRPLYAKLGFMDCHALARWQAPSGALAATAPEGMEIAPMDEAAMAGVLALDRELGGMERGRILAHLQERAPAAAHVARAQGRLVGYVLGRPGRRAGQIGPLVATAPEAAPALAAAAARAFGGAVILDVPEESRSFRRWLEERGAARLRGFTRMLQGSAHAPGEAAALHAIAGPELG
ncbi:GNAT family N-acetyltransferase [Marinimicrococcus flavescens]|uniref:GNAT family N-acetyltransferase n=1 Tax=Marinimicrococcus flavescens TaxID=3031815 RepID=A0AAP3V311_9PROT|nr:GNAT family N-acetyltransferase [Marinimicrococcus flavescens]